MVLNAFIEMKVRWQSEKKKFKMITKKYETKTVAYMKLDEAKKLLNVLLAGRIEELLSL